MEKELFDFIAERAQILATSEASKQETKDAAIAWQQAAAAEDEAALKDATTAFIDFLEGRPNTIENVIAFAKDIAPQFMGEEEAAKFLEAQLERQKQGAKFCDCPSCTAAAELLAKFGRVEL